MKTKTDRVYADENEVYINLPDGSAIRFIKQKNPNEILLHIHVHNPRKEIKNSEKILQKKTEEPVNILFEADMGLVQEISDGLSGFFVINLIKSLPTEEDWEEIEQQL